MAIDLHNNVFHSYSLIKNFNGNYWNLNLFDSIEFYQAYSIKPDNIFICGSEEIQQVNQKILLNYHRGILLHSKDSGKNLGN